MRPGRTLAHTASQTGRAAYADGPYYNFPASQKIAEGVFLIEAKGHTAGTAFEDLPVDWRCPRCRQGKDKFNRA